MKAMVTKAFRETVMNSNYNSEMKLSVLGHERMKGFVTRLTVELIKVQALRTNQGKPIFKAPAIRSLVKDFTETFLQGFHNVAEKRIESDLQKIQRQAELDKQAALEATANGKPTGEYAELVNMGVTIGDTKVTSNGQEKG